MKLEPLYIGITGAAGSGKDVVGDFLKKWMIVQNFWTITYAFGDGVKELSSKAFNIPIEYFYDRDLKEIELEHLKKTPREILQWFGTEVVRSVYPNRWIKYVGDKIDSSAIWTKEKYPTELEEIRGFCYIITDVRFQNEADFILENNGYIIEVVRKGVSILNEKTKNHSSEQGVDVPDKKRWVLFNNDSLESLDRLTKLTCDSILNKHVERIDREET